MYLNTAKAAETKALADRPWTVKGFSKNGIESIGGRRFATRKDAARYCQKEGGTLEPEYVGATLRYVGSR